VEAGCKLASQIEERLLERNIVERFFGREVAAHG